MKTKKILLIVIALLAVTACKKSNQATGPTKTTVDVYVVGYAIAGNGAEIAVYWKNGKIIRLSDSLSNSRAYGIAVQGNDVYAVGYTHDATYSVVKAIYWKNGVGTFLDGGPRSSSATSIALQGSDVYIGGESSDINGNSFATYWKNGVATMLPPRSVGSFVTSIAINGSDVYFAGGTVFDVNGHFVASYWKNGGPPVALQLLNGAISSTTTGIAVNGADVYVAGNSLIDVVSGTTHTIRYVATYWKNGVATQLTDTTSNNFTNSIATNGADVFVVGSTHTSAKGNSIATYWKNNVPVQLVDASPSSGAYGIAFNNTDVYVVSFEAMNTVSGVIIWKNGVPSQLSNVNGKSIYASQIVVVSH